MRTSVFALAGALAGSLLGAAPLAAQARAGAANGGKALQVTPYVGYLRFGDYLDGPLGTTLSNANAPLYGAQLGLKLAPNVSLVGNLAYSRADVEVGVPFIGGVSVGSSTALLYDGGLQVDVPARALPIAPFVQAGVGAIRYDIRESVLRTQATNLAANVGVGFDIPLGRSAGIRAMAKDYIGRFDFADAAGLDIRGKTAHNWAFTAGLRLEF